MRYHRRTGLRARGEPLKTLTLAPILLTLGASAARAADFNWDWATLGSYGPTINGVGTYDYTSVFGSGLNARVTITAALGTGGSFAEQPSVANTGADMELQLYPNFSSRVNTFTQARIELFQGGGFTQPAAVTIRNLVARDIDGTSRARSEYRDVVQVLGTDGSAATGPTVVGSPPNWTGGGGVAAGNCTELPTLDPKAAAGFEITNRQVSGFVYRQTAGDGCGAVNPAPQRVWISDFTFSLPDYDFGDAPASYGDASHRILDPQRLWLGNASGMPDAESGSQYTSDATGDNVNGSNDEQAVTIRAVAGGAIQTLMPVVNSTGAQASLCAWLDGAADGTANGTFEPAEGQCYSVAPGLAATGFSWTVPSTSPIDSFFRVRVTSGALTVNDPTGGASDGEVEDYLVKILPTRAVIGRFEVELDPESGLAAVAWETLSEQGTLGFYVERWDPGLERWTRLNGDLLPGLIDAPMGGEYRMTDNGVAQGERHRYRLIELESWGGTNTYGPYEVRVGGSKRRAAPQVGSKMRGLSAAGSAGTVDPQGESEAGWGDWRALAPGFEGRARKPSWHPRGGRRTHLFPTEDRP